MGNAEGIKQNGCWRKINNDRAVYRLAAAPLQLITKCFSYFIPYTIDASVFLPSDAGALPLISR